jgi:hypothetical protein
MNDIIIDFFDAEGLCVVSTPFWTLKYRLPIIKKQRAAIVMRYPMRAIGLHYF